MKIRVETARAKEGAFSEVKLCYKDNGLERRVPLVVRFDQLYEFNNDVSSLSFDLFLISSVVYGIDNLLERKQYGVDGWAREIQVSFPVRHSSVWQASKVTLEKTLNFLTGDFWNVSFERCRTRIFFRERKRKRGKARAKPDKSQYQSVNLFSGGLDSLVGAIDSLEALDPGQRIVLASHFDENAVGPNKDQKTLFDYLARIYPNSVNWVQARVFLHNEDTEGREISKDHNYRSRSLLFIAIATHMAASMGKEFPVLIPENGTISLNFPLNPSRSSSLSTRTTHPFFLACVRELLRSVGINVNISNPYQLNTKGELVRECKNRNVLQGIYKKSVSCAKRGRKQEWKNRKGTQHCGVCMPCIYRRAGLHVLLWDKQLYGLDMLRSVKPERFKDSPAIFEYLKTEFSKEQIKRGLLVNGSLPLDKLDQLADVVLRSRDELIKWIKDGGGKRIKSVAGIK